MIMCVLLCYPVSIHMSQLLSTGHAISSLNMLCSTASLFLTDDDVYNTTNVCPSLMKVYISVLVDEKSLACMN